MGSELKICDVSSKCVWLVKERCAAGDKTKGFYFKLCYRPKVQNRVLAEPPEHRLRGI